MRSTYIKAILRIAVLVGAGLLLTGGASFAADVYLQAQSFDKALPDGLGGTVMVPMWGFASCTDATFTTCDPPIATDAPGPQIDLATTDSLTIHLKNTLGTPVSIIIPGQTEDGGGAPEFSLDGLSRPRVRSFTHEAAPSGGTANYTWSTLRPGTYLYQSGTHPSIQVPMGLYGALAVNDGGPGQAYPGISYDADAVLLFSEIDVVQNERVFDATTPEATDCVQLADYDQNGTTTGYPCTVDYNPSYFLVNGETSVALPAGGGITSEMVLLRLLNAGLRTHTPAIVGLEMGLVAEDGNPYPGLTRRQSEALLPAGKTIDALVDMPADDVTFALFDRSPVAFGNIDPNQPAGGMLITKLKVGVGSGTPPDPTIYAVNDIYNDVMEDTLYLGVSVLTNDVGLAGATASVENGPANGILVLNADGTFTYQPNADFSGSDGFTYSADNGLNKYSAQVTLNVSFENDAPVAADDGPYVNAIGTTITVDAIHGVLGNDSDPDGDTLTAVPDGTLPTGLTLYADGSFTYTGGISTTFTYHTEDGNGGVSAIAMATMTINPVANITLNVEDPAGSPVTDYRWTVEEDTMWQPDPSVSPPPADTLATNFHRSYMPVLAQGSGAAEFAQLALDPVKHYYVSVLPADAGSGAGHTLGGARIPPGTSELMVNVNNQPLPYAQMSVFVFNDNSPTNGAVDGAETGLGGFQITLEDAGGRYGISGGMMGQDADGNPLTNSLDCFNGAPPATGVILTCPDTPANQAVDLVGQALIKNLYPGKYGVIVEAPAGDVQWVQTSTIEGTKVNDAWVKAGEPAFFQEFGPAGWHVFTGFVNPVSLNAANPGGPNSVTGKVTNLHISRPPDQTLHDSDSYDALAHTRAWVGLNTAGGIGPNIAAVQADPDGSFTINNLPDGIHQLVVWDTYLDQIIAYRTVTLPGGDTLGNVPVFQWFTRTEHNVFLDDGAGGGIAGDGIRNGTEAGLPEQAINLRWRDGTVNQSFPTDTEGFVPFDQTFPFFHWQVVEVDYTRFKPTGLTVTVDGGGDVNGGPYPGLLYPQDTSPRTETGPVLTQGFQGFLGQTSLFDWGKAPYPPGENGGISGIVYYASTRAENDPRLAVGEPWEPGIPRVKVRLYQEVETDTGDAALALVQEVETDSWDDNLPEDCPGFDPTDPILASNGGPISPDTKCYDGLRNFNQVRPGVFDGGYAFNDIPPGKYVVEVVPPFGYDLIKEEDNNVGFGDTFANVPVAVMIGPLMVAIVPDPATVLAAQAAEPGLAQPPCVGDVREVPPYMTLFPSENAEAPFAGALRPLCDRKEVILSDQGQAAADFFLFTGAPVAGHFVGMILDDVAQEFNPLSPQFGEKWAPPFVPISVRDHLGREISRTYSDQWGRMNGLVPSTFTANMPSPSGYSPAMLMTCMNDPGPIPNPDNPGQMIIDPQYNPAYSNFCYTFQYMPGTTTYLDTPVLPVSAFASGYNPPDCAFPDETPVITSVDSGVAFGPWLDSTSNAGAQRELIISSAGTMDVPNPAYEGPLASTPTTITRDFGFGDTEGTVTIGDTTLTIVNWTDSQILGRVPNSFTGTGELVVTRANGNSSVNTVTVTRSAETAIRVPGDHATIQAAIDVANPGDLILVESGSYDELVIMWKPVRLQGAGAGSTIINGVKRPTEKILAWRTKMDCLFGIGTGCAQEVNALPGQAEGAAGFNTEEGAAITVVGTSDDGPNSFAANISRIDGFSITGGDTGGGVFVNSYAENLMISNNHVFGNNGSYNGGIRVGRPFLDPLPSGSFNAGVSIHHNAITQNGGLGGAGGGLSLCTGTDEYIVSENFICGNFTTGDGGGIGHFGLSSNGLIESNQILFNQSFNQAVTVSGGGLFIGGEPGVPDNLSPGSGSITVNANLIQGNHAGAGHGGGIRIQAAGESLVSITNNMVVNNVAGWSGGGMSLQDTLATRIINNTIAHNDSTATVGGLIVNNVSSPQPAGIATELNSALLQATLPEGSPTFSDPLLFNNIVWQNRAFYYDATLGVAELQPLLNQTAVGECPTGADYWDLGVLGGAGSLNPTYSFLTDTAGFDPSNVTGDPDFLSAYCNGGRSLASPPGSLRALPALDEGGNAWIDVRYGPLTQVWPAGSVPWNYHITSQSDARNEATQNGAPDYDFDNNPRTGQYDIGADEFRGGGNN